MHERDKRRVVTGTAACSRHTSGDSLTHSINKKMHDGVLFLTTQVMLLLLEKGATITDRANDGNTALHLAAYRGEPQAVSLLVEVRYEQLLNTYVMMDDMGEQSA